MGLTKETILEAVQQFPGRTATCHEVVKWLGLSASWEREKVFTVLSANCEKIPLEDLDRDYAVAGGAAKWAYRLSDPGDLSGGCVDPDDMKLPL